MTEYQISTVVVIYVIIILAIALLVPILRILKRLRIIEGLLTSFTRKKSDDKDDVSNGEGKYE
jgi:hypothetical protein